MKRGNLIILVLLLLLSGVAFGLWLYTQTSSPVSGSTSDQSPSPSLDPAINSKPQPSQGTVSLPPKEGVNTAFTLFLETESTELNSTHVDVSASEEKVRRQAASMGEAEVRYARELVLRPGTPGNLRVMAAFLLTKANPSIPGLAKALDDLILAPTNSARAEPHSEAELSNVQTKAFAVMAIDALAEQAATDRGARDRLLRLRSEARDTTIQNYISQKVRSLPPL